MKYFKVVVVLTLVCVFSASILALADLLSKERIAENQKKAINEAILKIEPKAERIEEESGLFRAFNKEGVLLGYIFLAEGQGYQGAIKILTGLSSDLSNILGIEIIESQETPGLGAKINSGWFKEQFRGLRASPEIGYTKIKPTNPNQIQAITGATVSSKSVVNILNSKIKEVSGILSH